MTLRDYIKIKLRELGADGLYCGDGECGCSIDELAPCEAINLDECEPAKLGENDLFYPMDPE
jgi:hypothetical protein